MGKKINKSKKINARAEQAGIYLCPSWDNPEYALDWWRGQISNGYSPGALSESLNAIPPQGLELKTFERLSVLAGAWLSPSGIHCPDWIPAAVLLDRANRSLFFAGASHEGLGCFEAASGKSRWTLPPGTLGRAGGMALGKAGLYVCDRWRHRVLVLDPDNGKERAVLDRSPEGRPLDEPSDVLLLECRGTTELWVCARGNHRICRFSEAGEPLGWIGSRGLVFEETVQRFTRSTGEPEALMFEFPDSLDGGTDIDGVPAVFVSDSYNGRVVVLGTDGVFKRVITLTPPGSPVFCGQVRVVSMPDGPLVLGLNEADRTLDVHDHEGAPLVRLSLASTEYGSGRKACSSFVDCAEIPLVAVNGGSILSLAGPFTDIPHLLKCLAGIFPTRAGIGLSLAERRRGMNLPAAYDECFPGLSPVELVTSLLTPERALDRGLARNAMRLDKLAQVLPGNGHTPLTAVTLRERIASLAGENYQTLLSFSRPEEQTLDCWSNALADLDMDLVQTKGRNQQKEMELDDILEEIREHPNRTRRTAWTWRELNSILRSLGALDISSLAGSVTEDAVSLLRERRELLSGLSSLVDFSRDPSHLRRDELVALHRILQMCLSLERGINHLADGLIDNLTPEISLSETVLENLDLCASLDLPSGKWKRLREIRVPVRSASATVAETKAPGAYPAGAPQSSPNESAAALENMRILVENMARYLKALNEVGGAGGPFGRVVVLQKEIFAIKGSLLLNNLIHNGSSSAEAYALAARAGKLAGTAWDNTKNLRFATLPGEIL